MLRNSVLVVVLGVFFTNMSFAVVDVNAVASNDEINKQFSQAQNLAEQGEIDKAISVYQILIRTHPILPEAYNNLAALYLQQNKSKQAKQILEQGLHAHKGYRVLYENLTAINVAMAKEAYSKALQIDLKPSPISIASLSLPEKKYQTKNDSIVISKANHSVPLTEEKTLENISIIEPVKKVVAELPAAEIVRTKPVLINDDNSQSVENVLQAWSAAWSAQAIDMYLSFYHNKYRPTNGMSHKGWVQSRRYRLKKPRWIKVALSEIDIKKQGKTQAVVNFKQVYKSNSFNDVGYKQVVLINTEEGWRIFREKSF